MNKHTPGPWFIRGPWGETGFHVASGKKGMCFHVAGCEGRPGDENNANARLIAAAPDLLAACKYTLRYFVGDKNPTPDITTQEDWQRWVIRELEAAIAKAENK